MRKLASPYVATALAGSGGALLAYAALAALAACSAATTADSTPVSPFEGGALNDAQPTSDAGAPGADAGAAKPLFVEANALVLVHAAAFPAFRMCFEGAAADQPQPSVDLMPDSNVVGVDVGTAVRLAARPEKLGRAFVFPEAVLRPFYPTFGGMGPPCALLLGNAGIAASAVEVGTVTADVSSGVHALVLSGCRQSSIDPIASKARCGADWTAATGNLTLRTLTLMAYARGKTSLPVQLVQLSPALEGVAEGRALGLAFGPLDGGAPGAPGGPTPFVEGAVPFGEAVPNPPAALDYTATDLAAYATSGLFVTLGGPVDDAGMPLNVDAGARQIVIAQSLAEIQKRSSSRSLPADWFSVASSYVVLSVGDTDPRLGDGGHDDDPRRALHLLAVPLATPDAGASMMPTPNDDAGL